MGAGRGEVEMGVVGMWWQRRGGGEVGGQEVLGGG